MYLEMRVIDEFDERFYKEMLNVCLLINFWEFILQEA